MNRGTIVLQVSFISYALVATKLCFNRDIDEAEYLLDQLGAPDKDEDKLVTKLRNRLSLFLKEIRQRAEGTILVIM